MSHKLDGNHDVAATQLQTALESFRALDTNWQMARTLLELGEVERSRGNYKAAKEHYSEALAAFEELEAAPDAERAREALQSLN